MKIRRPTVSDIAAIFACHKAAVWNKAKSHYDEAVLKSWSPGFHEKRAAAAEREMLDDAVVFRVAEIESEIIGFGIALPQLNEFRGLYVRPTNVTGVGKRLCTEVLEAARSTPCRHLDLNASLNAVDFYRRMGADVIEPTEHQFADGVKMSAIKMRFDLRKVS